MSIRLSWRTLLAVVAIQTFAHSSQAAVETKTLHVDFVYNHPKSVSTWTYHTYVDNGDTPLIKVDPWGGNTCQGIKDNMFTDEASTRVFKTLWLTGGGVRFNYLRSDFDTDEYAPYSQATGQMGEGRGAGFRIDPIIPNSSAQCIRIKSVKGYFYDTGYCKKISASTGSQPTITLGPGESATQGAYFTWNAGANPGSTLGLYFWQECWLSSMDVVVEVVNGDDITQADLTADDLFARQWPEHLYYKDLAPSSNNGATTLHRIPFQQLLKIQQAPTVDIHTEDFTCVASEGLGVNSMWNMRSRAQFSNYYSDGVHGVATISKYAGETHRVPGFKARITRDKEGKRSRIVWAKIYFESAMKPTTTTDGVQTQWNWGKVVSPGQNYELLGDVEYRDTDNERQFLLWTGDTDELDIQFGKRTRTNVGAWSEAIVPDNYTRCIRYVELGIKTEDGASARPNLVTSTGEILGYGERWTYQQAGDSVLVSKPSAADRIYCVKVEDGALMPDAVNADGTVNADVATLTNHGTAIALGNDTKMVDVMLIATDASGNVLGTSRNQLYNSKHQQLTTNQLQGRTYTWTDINGEEHTSLVTDAATDPLQMMALFKYVYTTPYYPGTLWRDLPDFGRFNGDDGNGMVNYSNRQSDNDMWSNVWDNKLLPEGSVYSASVPTEGVSMFIIEAQDRFDIGDFKNGIYKYGDLNGGTAYSDSWKNFNGQDVDNNLIRFSETFKSVRLLQNSQRLEDNDRSPKEPGYNPGTLFTVSGEYDRFYFVTKGRTTDYSKTDTYLRHMYEEIAPEINTGEAHLANDVYGSLLEGEEPTSDHDCFSVPYRDHWLRMKSNGEAQRMDNMLIYIPDYRFNSGLSSLSLGANGSYYTAFSPTLGLYVVQLDAETEQADNYSAASPDTRWYDILLNWETSMKRMNQRAGIENAVKEEFKVFWQELNTETGLYGPWQQLDVTPDATIDGEGPVYFGYSTTYQTLQATNARYLNYRVYARLRGSNDSWVLSNEDAVVIPGYGETELILLPMEIAYISDFDIQDEHNHYKNYLTMLDKSRNAMAAYYLPVGTQLKVFRVPAKSSTEGHETELLFCTITITDKLTADGITKLAYRLSYDNQESSSYFDASLRAPETGHFTVLDNGKVDFGLGFYMLDQFAASVADNDHAPHYDYIVKFDSQGSSYVSNRCRVPVLKTQLNTTVFNFDQDDVDNDIKGATPLDNTAMMTVKVGGESNILEYAALRNGEERVGVAQRGSTGNYTTFKQDTEGRLTVVLDRVHVFPHENPENTASMLLGLQDEMPVVTGNESAHRWYVAQVEALTQNWPLTTPMYKSTYGTARTHVDQPKVYIETVGKPFISERLTYVNDVAKQDFLVPLKVYGGNFEPSNGESSKPALFRVWRVIDGDSVLLNTLEESTVTPIPGATYFTGYGNLSQGLVDQSGQPVEREFNDRFFSDPLDDDQELNVTYVVRLYAEANQPSAAPAPRRHATPRSSSATFSMANNQNEVPISKGGDVITAVTDVASGQKAVQVVYTNALGQTSQQPWPGANIVVTRYNDGTVVTSKAIY